MWNDYSKSYIKNNRASSLSVIAAAFISALLLSLLCSLFYNLWKYEAERIELEEGPWHSRIEGVIRDEDLEMIRDFAHVESADRVPEQGTSPEPSAAVDLRFDDMGLVLENTPRIAALLDIPPENISYHHSLLALYMVRDPQDTAPRLIFPLFLAVTIAASLSLIAIIHNSFAVSMNARVRQLGILSSIGATPKQLRACLLQEAAALCAVPVAAGDLLGILTSMGLLRMSNALLDGRIEGRHEAVFGYHPLVFALTLLATVATVWISAWMPARKLSRLTPLEAIRDAGEPRLKRRNRSRLLALLFGVPGELAGNALKAQKKALRTASLSLVFSFLAFTVMQCFFTLSAISTRETYFERYMGVWDVMATVKNASAGTFAETDEIRSLPGAESVTVYQKAAARRVVASGECTDEMLAFGGFEGAPAGDVTPLDWGWLVNAPLVILDDAGFLSYCAQIGAEQRLDGAVILNRIRDVTNPDFRHPRFFPYIREDAGTSVLLQAASVSVSAEVPVLAYTDQVPPLREEYATLDYYELVHFLPVSLWREIGDRIGGAEPDFYIQVRARENATRAELDSLQQEIRRLLTASGYTAESENRLQEQETNDTQIRGMMAFFSLFCILLAVIGAGSLFSNALGFVRQRKREFARYLSVGLTPEEIRKIFCIEALVIAGRPVLITVPAAALAVFLMLRASYMDPGEFLAEAPLLPIAAFLLAILASVALAYRLGWRGLQKLRLAEILRDDTML